MKGWQIFVHSVRLVLRNLDHAVRLSAVLYLVPALGQVAAVAPSAEARALQGLFGLAAIVTSLWIAVAWHRFVLEEEYPSGWLPAWHGGRVLSYLGRSILVGLAVGAAVMLALVPVGLAAAVSPMLGSVMAAGLVGLGAYLFFRLGVVLPAAAIGGRLSLREAWAATRDRDGAVVVLAFIVLGGSAVMQGVLSLTGGPGSLSGLALALVAGWVSTMVGASLLTTLYGHYVQGRTID